MTDARAVLQRLQRLAKAAPGAFRDDAVFRYAALGAGAAVLASAFTSPHQASSVPAPAAPPPKQALGASYNDRTGLVTSAQNLTSISPVSAPIVPSRSLDGVTINPDSKTELDRFGVANPAPTQRSTPHGHK